MSVRVKLTLSYAGFLMLAGTLLMAAVWAFLLRYVPDRAMLYNPDDRPAGGVFPVRSVLLDVFAPRAAAVMAFLLLFGLVGGWILAGHMLAPLTRITEATRTATDGLLSHRIRMPGRADEFRELADAFDTMLERLEAHVAEQQRFAANASHELRTPLATTRALLDVARRDPDRDIDEIIERLGAINARAIDLTEALLVLSRADRRTFTAEPVDLFLLVEEAAETLLPLGEKRGVGIDTSGGVATTSGSPALLLQMTTNLVHNAIVHNLPERGNVWVRTGTRPGNVVLTVENTGEKLSPQLVSTLTERFQRGTERIHGDHAGVGLGLAIVQRIVHVHDGSLTLTPRVGGGLHIAVQLPAPVPRSIEHSRDLTVNDTGEDVAVAPRQVEAEGRAGTTVRRSVALRAIDSLSRPEPWKRGRVLAALALLVGLLLPLHAQVPNRIGNLGSLVETFLPWFGVCVPVLLAGALWRRSASAVVALLLPVVTWLGLFGGLLTDKSHPGGYLTVVSHNVDAENPDPHGTARELAASGAELLALEEISTQARPVYEEELARAYPYHSVQGTVGLWSTLPLSDVRPVDIALDVGPLGATKSAADKLLENRALRATVTTDHGPLTVYVAHLGSVRVNPRGGFATKTRNRNAEALARAVAAERSTRMVLVGDLNGTMDDRALDGVTAQMRSAHEAAGNGFGFSWPATFPVVRIDQILTRGVESRSSWVLPATGSDHRPVAARVRW